MPFRLAEPPLFTHLQDASTVLIAGAGGGLDGYGGTDIRLRGDETGLGTPQEDMTSLAAVAGLDGAGRTTVRPARRAEPR